MNRYMLTIISFSLLLSNCTSHLPVSENQVVNENEKRVRTAIEKCSAGFNIELSANFEGSLLEYGLGDIAIKASLKRSMEGYFFSQVNVSESNAVELYKSYLKCIESDSSKDELISLLDLRKDRILNTINDHNQKMYADNFNRLYDAYILALKRNKSIVAHETNREIQHLLSRFIETMNQHYQSNEFDKISSGLIFSGNKSEGMLSNEQASISKERKLFHKQKIEAAQIRYGTYCGETLSLWISTNDIWVNSNTDTCSSLKPSYLKTPIDLITDKPYNPLIR